MNLLRASVVTLVLALLAVPGPAARTTLVRAEAATLASLASPVAYPRSVAGDVDPRDARAAAEALGDLQRAYRLLDGVTVTFGDTPRGHEAVAYYTQGRIVISRTHTVDVVTILRHEVWHIIDWRDDQVIDWGESLPPAVSTAYLTG